jgi:hypothetical protein
MMRLCDLGFGLDFFGGLMDFDEGNEAGKGSEIGRMKVEWRASIDLQKLV